MSILPIQVGSNASLAAVRMRAFELVRARRWTEAEKEWRRLQSADPADAQTTIELAEVLRRTKRHDEADRLLSAFVAKSPSEKRFLVPYARNAFARGDLAPAIERWQRVLEIDGEYFEAHLRLGALYLRKGDVTRANLCLTKARQASPDHPDLVRPLAQYCDLVGRLEEAAELYRRVLTQTPASSSAGRSLAQVLIRLEQFQAADEVLEGVSRQRHSYPLRISIDVGLGRWTHAIETFQGWMTTAPPPEAAAAKGWEILRGVANYPSVRKPVLARMLPLLRPLLSNLVSLARRDTHYEMALTLVRRSSNPRSERALLQQAELLTEMRRFAAAEQICKKMLAADAQNVGCLRMLDRINAAAQAWEECLAYRRRISELEPDSAAAIREVGVACATLDKYGEAEEAFLRCLQLDPSDAEAIFQLGLLRFRAGRYRAAESFFRESIAVCADLHHARRYLGHAQRMLGNRARCIETYMACLTAAPWDLDAFCALLELEGRERPDTAWRHHLAAVEAAPVRSKLEWSFLAQAQIRLGDLDQAVGTLRRAIYATGSDPMLLFLTAHAQRLAGQFEAALASARAVLAAYPFYYRAFDEVVQILCAMGRSREAKQFLQQKAFYFSSADVRARGLGLLTHVHFGTGDLRRGFANYRESSISQVLRRHVGEAKFIQSVAQLRQDRRAIVLAAWGIGDEINWSQIYPQLAARCRWLTVTCDPRLLELLQRSFPQVRFLAVARWMGPEAVPTGQHARLYGGLPDTKLAELLDAAAWDAVTDADQVAVVTDLLADLRGQRGDFPRAAGYLVPDPRRVEFWRRRLAALGDGPKVGIGWTSVKQTHQRRVHFTDLSDWEPVLRVPRAIYVSLQAGDVDEEIEAAIRRFGVEIVRFPDLDAKADLDDFAALAKSLDLAISIINSTAELCGAVGTPTWLLNRSSIADWRIADDDGGDLIHRSQTHLIGEPRRQISALMQAVAQRLHAQSRDALSRAAGAIGAGS